MQMQLTHSRGLTRAVRSMHLQVMQSRGLTLALRCLRLHVLLMVVLAGFAAGAEAHYDAEVPYAGAQYELAGGCYTVRSEATRRSVALTDGGYRSASVRAERFRLQATNLGRYLLYGADGDFLTLDARGAIAPTKDVRAAAEWAVDVAGGAFTVAATRARRLLAVAPGGGALALIGAAGTPDSTRFQFEKASGCRQFPEAEVNATGEPFKGPTAYGEVRGLIDLHAHMMSFEAFGRGLHCGRPWHPLGITEALRDCPDHYPNGSGALVENVAAQGDPLAMHDPVGWPTFKDWPDNGSYVHEGTYYKWLERVWRAGLRLYVMLAVDNSALCMVNPQATEPCNDMAAVRREIADTYALQDYIDAQNGGPGKGWFRIVKDPFEARRTINDGKLAVILGIEVSEPFDCGLLNGVPNCDREKVDRGLDEVHALGVRQMEIVNKFDNAFTGVALDGGVNGPIVNLANRIKTGRWWQLETCTGPDNDNTQVTSVPASLSPLADPLVALLPPGEVPVYPQAPHCNTRGLSTLGDYLLRRMIDRRMVFDPDHMSVVARQQALSVMESNHYSGVVSSHSWADTPSYRRILALGGVVTPYAGSSRGFAREWARLRPFRDARFYFGWGFGDDMGGFGGQGPPRDDAAANPVSYPFKSFDGGTTLDRPRTGERVWDINTDGVDQIGLYADWVEDLRKLAGDQIIHDMARGAEAYLQMWERAQGVPTPGCRPTTERFTARGLGAVRLVDTPEALLRRAGQPASRPGRVFRWCVRGKANRSAEVVAVFTRDGRVGLVASSGRGHRAAGLGVGDRASKVRRKTSALSSTMRIRRTGTRGARVVYRLRRGRVRSVAVAAPSVAKRRSELRAMLRLAGL